MNSLKRQPYTSVLQNSRKFWKKLPTFKLFFVKVFARPRCKLFLERNFTAVSESSIDFIVN